ncbi:SH3 domain-containing protein [Microbacterium sp. HJ5]
MAAKTYTLSSYFGPRCIPVPGASTYHFGVDLAARSGTPIYAIAPGTVTATVSGTTSRAGYISIRHTISGVTYTSIYMHIWSATTRVKVGQKVTAGQRISEVGNSGVSSGSHLHLELWRAGTTSVTAENAGAFLKARGVDIYAAATLVTARPAPATCTYYSIGALNLRSGPSVEYDSLRLLPQGTAIVHVPGKITSGFIPVRVGTQSGWVSSSLVSPVKPPPAPAALPTGTYFATAALAFRAAASSSGVSLGVIPKDAKVGAILALSASWAKVTYSGKTGWVQRAYLTTTVPATPAATPPPIQYATAALAFRATASSSGVSLGVIPKDAKVGAILALSASWAKVTYAGKTGWVQHSYLTTTVPTPPATAPAPTNYATAALAFRATASTSSTSFGVIPKGSAVGTILATSASWAKVTYSGKTGWVQRAYLTTTPPAPPAPAPAPTNYATAALAFRATASTTGTSLGVIPKGSAVGTILATSASWAKVTYSGKTGWVQRAYLTTTPPGPPTYVATVALAFRATASTAGTSLGVIPKGADVGVILATSASWAKVTYSGKTGWVQRSAITLR